MKILWDIYFILNKLLYWKFEYLVKNLLIYMFNNCLRYVVLSLMEIGLVVLEK